MDFAEAVRAFYRQYTDFSGRSCRSAYWWVILFQVVIYLILIVAVFAVTFAASDDVSDIIIWAIMVPVILFFLVNIIPGIAVAVRRLHDMNFSGWWILAFILGGWLPFVGILVSIARVVIFAQPGTRGDNRFGHDPLISLDEVFR